MSSHEADNSQGAALAPSPAATQRHKYDYRVNPNTAAEKVVRMVGAGKRVLELGSGPGSITRLLKGNRCSVTALELDDSAIELVSPYCEQVYRCDLNSPQWSSLLGASRNFDVIVAGDVLEHLYDPWAVLSAVPPLLAEDGYVVISLPHIGHNAVIACLLAGDFGYQPWGLLDKTHIRFFGIENIQKLFESAGLKIVAAEFVTKAPEQTEFSQQWRQLSPSMKQALGSNRFGTIYQVVVKAVRADAAGNALQLVSLSVPAPPASALGAGGNRLVRLVAPYLSVNTRRRISGVLGRLGIHL